MARIIESSYEMKVNGLTCQFNMPDALKSRKGHDGEEIAHSLPPHKRVVAYPVDEYPACPDTWMHGSSKSSSYFLAIEEGKGMWLDFNGCNRDNYDVAAVVSVQGVNSVTGQKTDVMRLEQYKTKCPVHDVEFQQDRFCPECKYKWPAQNYIATTGTPSGNFWLDGFRSKDGVVRQYIFTADEAKGVAAKKIGKDRVFAIGIAFYRSKKPKPTPPPAPTRAVYSASLTKTCSLSPYKGLAAGGGGGVESDVYYSPNYGGPSLDSDDSSDIGPIGTADAVLSYAPQQETKTKSSTLAESLKATFSLPKQQHTNSIKCNLRSVDKEVKTSAGIVLPDVITEKQFEVMPQINPKTYEVGAGARINQEVYPDPKDLDYWEPEPAGMIYINYTDSETVATILAAGRREEKEEGMLEDVAVGND